MNKNEAKHLEQLLINANQALNFLRLILDDLTLKIQEITPETKEIISTSQLKYKRSKATLINIENLAKGYNYYVPDKLYENLCKALRAKISSIIEESIELDKLR